jgi:hypothetical protein
LRGKLILFIISHAHKKNSQKKLVYQPLQYDINACTANELDVQVSSYPLVSGNVKMPESQIQSDDDYSCFVLVTGMTRHLQVKPKIHNNGQLTQQVSSCWYSNNSYFSYATMTLLATVRTIFQHASNLHKINLKYKILEDKLF